MPTEGIGGGQAVAWGRQVEAVATKRDRASFITLFQRAPCKGAISQWEIDPPGNFRSGR